MRISLYIAELNEIIAEYEIFGDRKTAKQKLSALYARVKKAAKHARNLRENKELRAIMKAIESILKGL